MKFMTVQEIKDLLKSKEYDFLKTNPHLGKNLILLGLGGSHAYGTNIEGSDVDIRGIAINTKEEILGGGGFQQVVDETTDTTIYSLNKIISLLSNCNPNTIELLGLKPEHYLYLSPVGKELLDNRKMFLSKRALYSFGGYATSQLRRLDNKSMRTLEQAEQEQHILNSIVTASYVWPEKYQCFGENDYVNLYLDVSEQEDYDKEIFMDIHLSHYPLRDYKSMWSDMKNIVSDYGKLGQRNKKAVEHGKIAKHMMHLIRLYLMCIDILEKEEIITYREDDLEYLLSIRYGKFLDEDGHPISGFSDIVREFENRMKYAADNTSLPDKPDYKAIKEFTLSVNEGVVLYT
jgi:predicted nucleotidyltransferase